MPYWYDLHGGSNNAESNVVGDFIRWDEPEVGDMWRDYSLPADLVDTVPKYSRLWDPRTHSHYYFNNWEGTSQFDVPLTGSQKCLRISEKVPSSKQLYVCSASFVVDKWRPV